MELNGLNMVMLIQSLYLKELHSYIPHPFSDSFLSYILSAFHGCKDPAEMNLSGIWTSEWSNFWASVLILKIRIWVHI